MSTKLDADAHNFGRRTTLRDGKILKFRDLTCEFLFLSPFSPLRKLLSETYHSAFSGHLLPSLEVSLEAREIEFLECENKNFYLNENDFRQIGAFTALVSWAGLTDCHQTNMMLGRKNGELIFSSLDWETVFTEYFHPYETSLYKCLIETNSGVHPNKFFGLSLVVPHLQKENSAALVLSGHLRMKTILEENQNSIRTLLSNLPEMKTLIRRVVLRHTFRYLPENVGSEKLIPEERVQLDRGDIPYFFQIGQSPDVYWWKTETLFEKVDSLMGNFRWPEYPANLIDKTLVAIARSLDCYPNSTYVSRHEQISILYKENSIVVMIGDQIFTGSRLVERG